MVWTLWERIGQIQAVLIVITHNGKVIHSRSRQIQLVSLKSRWYGCFYSNRNNLQNVLKSFFFCQELFSPKTFNSKNNIRVILKIILGEKETKLMQGIAVINLHSIFLAVSGSIFVRGYCGQLKQRRVTTFSVNLSYMWKKWIWKNSKFRDTSSCVFWLS